MVDFDEKYLINLAKEVREEQIIADKSVAEFKGRLKDFLNSPSAYKMLSEKRYKDLEESVVRLRKETIAESHHDKLMRSGYLDGITNRAILFKIYGMLSNLILDLQKKGIIEELFIMKTGEYSDSIPKEIYKKLDK